MEAGGWKILNQSTVMLLIPEPSCFYCEADEDHFFAWLQGIAAIKAVTVTPDGLDLKIETPIDRVSFYELAGLMTRYQLDKKCLQPLCNGHEDPWFNDKKNYGYKFVFG